MREFNKIGTRRTEMKCVSMLITCVCVHAKADLRSECDACCFRDLATGCKLAKLISGSVSCCWRRANRVQVVSYLTKKQMPRYLDVGSHISTLCLQQSCWCKLVFLGGTFVVPSRQRSKAELPDLRHNLPFSSWRSRRLLLFWVAMWSLNCNTQIVERDKNAD